ncbi:hypothetical protein FB451DRAFT_1179223 [Mycena latifolia]|nr:hypothetical protein FB451DRAFT_1179223 [Mycena latifolia]
MSGQLIMEDVFRKHLEDKSADGVVRAGKMERGTVGICRHEWPSVLVVYPHADVPSALQTLKANQSKKQDRLYLALSHRHSQPTAGRLPQATTGLSFSHQRIPTARSTETDAKCWDITNLNSAHEWQFRDALLSQYAAPSLVVRVLLRKLDPSRRSKFRKGTLRSSALWALNGVDALRKSGRINIPFEREALEEKATSFADECMRLLLSSQLDVATHGASVIPVLDLRASGST